MNASFERCTKMKVDMESSVDAVLAEYAVDPKSDGAVFLAWDVSYDPAQKQHRSPSLVGACTVSKFVSCDSYSTDAASVSARDLKTLRPYFGKHMYVDALCSTRAGVGSLLVLYALRYTLRRRKEGLVALAFSARANQVPESKRIFEKLGFTPIISKANFNIRMYGTWYALRSSDIGFQTMNTGVVRACTRTVASARTADRLI